MTIYSENNVPVLFRGNDQRIGLSSATWDTLEAAHKAAQDALQKASQAVAAAGDPDSPEYDKARTAQAKVIDEHLLIGDSVLIDNPDDQRGDYTYVSIGASDLLEAVQEAVASYDLSHVGEQGVTSDNEFTPAWVASTDEELAAALGDYYSCEVRDLNEVR